MSGGSALPINADISIPRNELTFRASRAGGPGGQHVNTSSTRVEILWNVDQSRALTADQRSRLRGKLGGRIDSQGNVRVVASAHRSQTRNREDAEGRLATMIRRALVMEKPRKKTRPHRGAVEARLFSKKLKSQKKKERQRLSEE